MSSSENFSRPSERLLFPPLRASRSPSFRRASPIGVDDDVEFIPGEGAPATVIVTQALVRLDDDLATHQRRSVATGTCNCEGHRAAQDPTSGSVEHQASVTHFVQPLRALAESWFLPGSAIAALLTPPFVAPS